MTRTLFNRMCKSFKDIAHMGEPKREQHLKIFMSQGYLFFELTEKQVNELKQVLKEHYPDKYIEYDKPDERGFVAEFECLRFKCKGCFT